MLDAAAEAAFAGLKEAGVDFVSGLPDGWQRSLHERVEADPEIQYVPASNEGAGFSVCAGAVAGRTQGCLDHGELGPSGGL